jgi:hypothetical protein
MGIKIIDKSAKKKPNRVWLVGKEYEQNKNYFLLLNISLLDKLIKVYFGGTK